MTSKAAKRRNRKNRRTGTKAILGPQKPQTHVSGPAQRVSAHAERPTPERMAHGVWAEAVGAAKSQQPIVDLAHDVIGRLHCDRIITDGQEQAARTYQELHAAYMAELPELTGYKSCLAGGTGAYDGSDGNPETIAAMRKLQRKVGMIGGNALYRACVENTMPRGDRDTAILVAALEVVAG